MLPSYLWWSHVIAVVFTTNLIWSSLDIKSFILVFLLSRTFFLIVTIMIRQHHHLFLNYQKNYIVIIVFRQMSFVLVFNSSSYYKRYYVQISIVNIWWNIKPTNNKIIDFNIVIFVTYYWALDFDITRVVSPVSICFLIMTITYWTVDVTVSITKMINSFSDVANYAHCVFVFCNVKSMVQRRRTSKL